MARDLKLAMTLLARDQGSKVLRQSLTDINRQITANKKASDDAARSEQQNAQGSLRASRTLQQEYQRAASARETLGIRSERSIQREITQTQAAFMRLLRTGTMSAQEQSRAFDAMTRKVKTLRDEISATDSSMSRLEGSGGAAGGSRFERARNWGSNAIAGGVAAAGAVVAPSVTNQMNYEQRLAMMANTAFAERDIGGRREGMQSMDKLVRRAVSVGGGSKESAAETLDTLLASGAVDYNSAERLLPMLQKYSTATGADSKDLAQIAIRLKQNFGITDEQIPTALNMSIKSGQLGSFELKDQAKWLPQQLAAAGTLGMRGLDDYATLLGVNQASMITAGSTDEAGNNFVNLMTKINSQDAANAAARIKYNGKGIDLPGSLVAARGKGINAIDAFSGIVDKVVGNNPAYKKLENQLNNTKDEGGRREIMESQAKLLEGSAIGQVVADRQALMALVAYRANKKYAQSVIEGVNVERALPVDKQAGEQNYDLIKGTNLFKVNQLNNTRDFAQMDSVKSLSDVLGGISKELTDYAGAYPGLTKAMAGAELAIKAMTAAAMVFAGIRFLSGGASLLGKGGGAFNPADIITGSKASGVGPVPVYVTNWEQIGGDEKNDLLDKFKDLPGLMGKVATYLSAATALKEVVDSKLDALDKEASEKGLSKGELLVQKNLEQKGKPLIDFEFPSWSTPPTNIKVPSSANGYAIPPFAQTQTPASAYPTQIQLVVDGKVLAEAVNDHNAQNGSRGPQGGPH